MYDNTNEPIKSNIGKALTWDQLANLYPGIARTKPMGDVFKWFEDQPTKYYLDPNENTIHEIFYIKHKIILPFKTVGVKYATSFTIYTFMTEYDCKVGDKAVVFTNGNWSVVTITEVHDEPQLQDGYNYTYLVQIIDRTEYDRLVKAMHEGRPVIGNRL